MGRPQGTCTVLVSRVPRSVDKSQLHSLLSTFGNIISCDLYPGQGRVDRNDFYRVLAKFEAAEQAHQAIRNLTGYRFEGSLLRLNLYNPNHYEMNGVAHHFHHTKRHNGPTGGRNGSHPGISNGVRGGGGGGAMMNGGLMNGVSSMPNGSTGPPGYYFPRVGFPPRDLPLKMLVPSDLVGAIIGKSGATIKAITQQTRARVDVHGKDARGIYNDGLMEKVINIYGATEACTQACRKILEIILQESRDPTSHVNMNGNSLNKRGSDEPIHLRILAYNQFVGRVIGRNGACIKKVMEETGAKVNVAPMTDPRERVIVIKGSIEEMSKAQQQISAKLRHCFEQDVQSAMMGGGYGGPMGMGLPGDLGPPPQMAPPLSYSFHRPPLTRHPSHGHHAGAHGGPNGFGQPSPYGPVVPMTGGHFMPPEVGCDVTTYLWVPTCTVGAIIGSGGSSIREMIRYSGCSIKVAQTKDDLKSDKKQVSDNSSPPPGSSLPREDGTTNGTQSKAIDDTPTSSANERSTKRDSNQFSERKVTIIGTPEAQWKAQGFLFRKVFQDGHQYLESHTDTSKNVQLQLGHLKTEVHVPSSQVGRIIGKGGQTVKDLQRSSRAMIKLPGETSKRAGSAGHSEEMTPVYIIGDFYAVQSAQRKVRDLVAKSPVGGPLTNGFHAKKREEIVGTQKVEGNCNKSESQC